MTKINKFIVSAVLLGVVAVAGSVAIAAYGQTQPNFFGGGQGQFQQMVNEKLAEVSQIQHKRVCDVATGNNAACGARIVIDSSGKAKSSAALPSGYGPAQFLGAYGLAGKSASANQTIAIVDAYDDPNIAADVSTYSTKFGMSSLLPPCTASVTTSCLAKVNENGLASPLPQSNSSWDVEIALDVETAHAVCQNCRILLVEANSASFTDLLKAVDMAVSSSPAVVSGSWGASEFSAETTAAYDGHFASGVAKGVAFTFSAGDSGYGTLYPAASQYVTAVGGTTLLLNGNSYLSESVWDGTGSGCSAYEAKPSWQTSAIDPSCAKRTMNDVAADANPQTGAAVYDSVKYDGVSGWFEVGGTSLSSPFIAAVYAQGKISSSSQANSWPYAYLGTSALRDVTSGSNASRCSPAYLCKAGVGYDGPTGVGTPNGATAF